MESSEFEGYMQTLLNSLEGLLDDVNDEDWNEMKKVKSVKTFEEAGVLTTDNGIIVELNDGSVFHMVIKKYK